MVKITFTNRRLYAKQVKDVLVPEYKTNYSFSYKKEQFVEKLQVTH